MISGAAPVVTAPLDVLLLVLIFVEVVMEALLTALPFDDFCADVSVVLLAVSFAFLEGL
jgi:hypothetical protein